MNLHGYSTNAWLVNVT